MNSPYHQKTTENSGLTAITFSPPPWSKIADDVGIAIQNTDCTRQCSLNKPSVCYHHRQLTAQPHGDDVIDLKYPGCSFDENVLIKYIQATGSDYIVQGQKSSSLAKHAKPQSLDVWLRTTFPKKCDMKLADNYVLDALVQTGKFEIATNLKCPTSGRLCKGLRLIA